MRSLAVALAVAAAHPGIAPGAAAATVPQPAERAALMKAAGIVARGGREGCAVGEAAWPASQFSFAFPDLNRDGRPEAIVSEDNAACYGATGTAFTVLARGPDGAWRKLAQEVGIATVRASARGGWSDIEVGGPGFGQMPVLRWNGSAYTRGR